jgi:hypothetical protein
MARLWSMLRSGGDVQAEERLTLDDYASILQKSPYPVGFMSRGVSQKFEPPDDEFQTYIYQTYKSDGIVFACMQARQLIFSEARFQFQRMRLGRPGDMFGTKDLEILDHPWPNGSTGELLTRAMQDTDLAGNFYLLRETGGRLRRLRPDWVKIVLTEAPDVAVKSDILGYVYMPGGPGTDPKSWEPYPITGERGTVAHWSPIPDPDAQYKGMSWITPVIREVFADKEATRHKGMFFRNATVPNLAISFKETVTPQQFKEFMEQMDTKGGPEHAYENLYLGGGADVKVIGANLKEMDFSSTQGSSETRIAAAARVHPVILGLSSALSGSSLNAGNYGSAKRQFADGTLRPLWRSVCAALEPVVNVPHSSRLWYDDRDIAFLRQDLKELADIKATEARAISALIMDGYTPESIVEAVVKSDWTILKHTGLFSVQLQPPGTVGKALLPGGGAAPAPSGDGKTPPTPTPAKPPVKSPTAIPPKPVKPA